MNIFFLFFTTDWGIMGRLVLRQVNSNLTTTCQNPPQLSPVLWHEKESLYCAHNVPLCSGMWSLQYNFDIPWLLEQT